VADLLISAPDLGGALCSLGLVELVGLVRHHDVAPRGPPVIRAAAGRAAAPCPLPPVRRHQAPIIEITAKTCVGASCKCLIPNFDGKVSLFIEVMGLPGGMREVPAELRENPASGATIVRAFLRLWDEHATAAQPSPFLSLVQAVSSSPLAAQSVREFIAERIRPPDDGQPLSHEWRVRQALIGSQLMGLAFQRYILRAEPVVTADADQLAAWVGPAIDRYLHEPLAERGSGGSDR